MAMHNDKTYNNLPAPNECVEIARAYKYRLYPDAKRQKEIDEQMELARLLYNKLLEKVQNEYQKGKTTVINKTTLNRFMKEILSDNKEFARLYTQAMT